MKYWVDFSGYACIEADSHEQAEEKMWEAIHNAFDGRTVFDDVWDILCIKPLRRTWKTSGTIDKRTRYCALFLLALRPGI